MVHLSGLCTCGRQIHYPKWASYGHKWKCRNCGRVWVLSRTGEPLEQVSSKPPRPAIRPVAWLKKKAPGLFNGKVGFVVNWLLKSLLMFLLGVFVVLRLVLKCTLRFLEWASQRMIEKTVERSIKRDGVEVEDEDNDGSSFGCNRK